MEKTKVYVIKYVGHERTDTSTFVQDNLVAANDMAKAHLKIMGKILSIREAQIFEAELELIKPLGGIITPEVLRERGKGSASKSTKNACAVVGTEQAKAKDTPVERSGWPKKPVKKEPAKASPKKLTAKAAPKKAAAKKLTKSRSKK